MFTLEQEEYLTYTFEVIFGADRSDAQAMIEAISEKKKINLFNSLKKIVKQEVV